MNNDRLTSLFQRYYAQEATEAERQELMALLAVDGHEEALAGLIKEKWEALQAAEEPFTTADGASVLRVVLGQEAEAPVVVAEEPKRRIWQWWAAAAVLVVAAGTALLLLDRPSGKGRVAAAVTEKVVPGGNKATLQLADGSSIVLDDAQTGALGQQGSVRVVKLDSGQLAYQAGGVKANGVIGYNTLTTPKGGQYQVLLPDGSKVWLNAVSSLRYPIAFMGGERRVELSGEAYFEVAANAAMPFVVKVKDAEVKVLGTHFNVNAYMDESAIRTTLLEGVVQMSNGAEKALLEPGRQAVLSNGTGELTTAAIDVDPVVAWKNGLFHFEHSDVAMIMRQLSRWYEVEVRYEGKVPDKQLTGKIERSAELSDVLAILAFAGVNCRLEGRTVVVKNG